MVSKKNFNQTETWDLEIRPKTGWLEFNFRELWRYRDLIMLFVKRDFVAQYKQTILGPVWYLLQPLLSTLMFLVLFTRIARIPTDGVHPVVFYMTGITIWTYFSTCLTATSNTFISNARIFGKVYFPRLVTPISSVISNLIRFGIQFFLLLLTMGWATTQGFTLNFSFYWLVVPLLLILFACLGLGLGILISSLTTKYRDFTVLITFSIQLLMYATPIVYPISLLQDSEYLWLLELNPLTPLIEAFRFVLLGNGTFTLIGLIYSMLFTMVILFLGIMSFNRVEKSFMDTV